MRDLFGLNPADISNNLRTNIGTIGYFEQIQGVNRFPMDAERKAMIRDIFLKDEVGQTMCKQNCETLGEQKYVDYCMRKRCMLED